MKILLDEFVRRPERFSWIFFPEKKKRRAHSTAMCNTTATTIFLPKEKNGCFLFQAYRWGRPLRSPAFSSGRRLASRSRRWPERRASVACACAGRVTACAVRYGHPANVAESHARRPPGGGPSWFVASIRWLNCRTIV